MQNKTRKSNLHIPAARLLYCFCNAGSTHENIIGFALLQLNPPTVKKHKGIQA